jgi:hypothetical protein
VYGLDSQTGSIVWQKPIGGYYPEDDYLRSLELIKEGDINLDGNQEVIVGADDGFAYMLDAATGDVKAKFDTRGPGGASAVENIDVADLNGDGTVDIVAEQDGSSVVAEILIFKEIVGAVPGFEIILTPSADGTQIEVNITSAADAAAPIVVSFVIPANSSINLTNVNITATEGLTVISGLNLPAGVTKSAQVIMPAGSSSVCVDDSEDATLSASCADAGEVALACPGSNGGFSCAEISSTLFEISGLSHSAIGSYTPVATATAGTGGRRKEAVQFVNVSLPAPLPAVEEKPTAPLPEIAPPAEAAPVSEAPAPTQPAPANITMPPKAILGRTMIIISLLIIVVVACVIFFATRKPAPKMKFEEELEKIKRIEGHEKRVAALEKLFKRGFAPNGQNTKKI